MCGRQQHSDEDEQGLSCILDKSGLEISLAEDEQRSSLYGISEDPCTGDDGISSATVAASTDNCDRESRKAGITSDCVSVEVVTVVQGACGHLSIGDDLPLSLSFPSQVKSAGSVKEPTLFLCASR